jgi:hypothetical protein
MRALKMELCVVFATLEKMQHQSSRSNGCRSAAVSTDFRMATGKLPWSIFEIQGLNVKGIHTATAAVSSRCSSKSGNVKATTCSRAVSQRFVGGSLFFVCPRPLGN